VEKAYRESAGLDLLAGSFAVRFIGAQLALAVARQQIERGAREKALDEAAKAARWAAEIGRSRETPSIILALKDHPHDR
jgi:hypothetical protein